MRSIHGHILLQLKNNMGGFFKNIGSNVREEMLNELVDWIWIHDRGANRDDLMNNLVIKDDLTVNYSSDIAVKITLLINDNDKYELPFPFKFGDDIDFAIIFAGTEFNMMNQWGKILPKRIVNMSMVSMSIRDWGWLNGVEYIEDLNMHNSAIHCGFDGFHPGINNKIEMMRCDIPNLKGLPTFGNFSYINIFECFNLKDISGLGDNNSKFRTVSIRRCNDISDIGDLSGIIIDNLYVNSSFIELAMTSNCKLFKEIRKKVNVFWDSEGSKEEYFKDYYDKATDINKYICNMYPDTEFEIHL